MPEEGRREFWKYALFTAATSVLVGHMFYTMWLSGAWVYASDLATAIGWIPDGATGVTAGLLFGFGIYLGFLLVFMQNRRKYYQGLILLIGTVGSIGLLGALGIGLPGFEPSPLNGGAFVAGLVIVVLAEMIDTDISVPVPNLGDEPGLFTTVELEGRLHQIDLERSSWGHAVDVRGDELTFPVATYGLLGYIIAVVLVSNVMNFLVADVGSLQIAHLGASVLFLWVLGSFLSLNPSSDTELQVLGPTQSGKTYFVLAAALEAQRNDRFEMDNSVGWINEQIEKHKEWARKNRERPDRDLDWDIGFTAAEQIYQTNFTVTTNDRLPKAFHFNVIDHAGEILAKVADSVGERAVGDGGTSEEGEAATYVCPECGFETDEPTARIGDICPECQEGYLRDGDDADVTAGEEGAAPEERSFRDRVEDIRDRRENESDGADQAADEEQDSADQSPSEAVAADDGSEETDRTVDESENGAEYNDTVASFSGGADAVDDEDAEIIDGDDGDADESDEVSVDDDGAATEPNEPAEDTDSAQPDTPLGDDSESMSQAEIVARLEEKVLESDTLLLMLDCERLIGRAPAGPGSESLETAEMNRIVNGADPDQVILVGTKADVLIEDWKPWHLTHYDGNVDTERLPAPHEVERYEQSFREYVTERFESETGMLLSNADTSMVYPVYFETERVDTSEDDADPEEKPRRDDDLEWAPVPDANGELQPHGYDEVLSVIAQDG